MPKLSQEKLNARAEHILDAAEQCFAETGIHRTTVHDICARAEVSPGALYRYFRSKEDLIFALCDRDRARFAMVFTGLVASDDLMAGFAEIAREYLSHQPAWKRRLAIELGLEGTRSPKLGEVFHSIDQEIRADFTRLFEDLSAHGRIAPIVAPALAAETLMTLGDGLFWRRAVHDDFDVEQVLPATLSLLEALLRPGPHHPAGQRSEKDTASCSNA